MTPETPCGAVSWPITMARALLYSLPGGQVKMIRLTLALSLFLAITAVL
jgi:hypothetical protein